MSGYNILLPDSSRDMLPELTLPAMDALQQLGHTPVLYDMAAMAELYNEMRLKRHGGYELFLFYAKDIIAKGNVDFALSFGLSGILEDGAKSELHYLPEEFKVPGAIYTHGRQADAVPKLVAAGAARWEYTTVYCSSHSYAQALREAGIERAQALPLGYSPRLFYPQVEVPANAAYPLLLDDERLTQGFSVSFAGGWTEFRATVLAELLEADIELAVFGDALWQGSALGGCYRGSLNRIEQLNTLYNASPINLDLPAEPDWGSDYVSSRVVECLGSGGFMLSLEQPGLGVYAQAGSEIAVAADADSVVGCVLHWLDQPEERQWIAAAGHVRVAKEARWSDRLKQLLAKLELGMLAAAK